MQQQEQPEPNADIRSPGDDQGSDHDMSGEIEKSYVELDQRGNPKPAQVDKGSGEGEEDAHMQEETKE